MSFCTRVSQKTFVPSSFCRAVASINVRRSDGSSAMPAPTSPPQSSPSASDPEQFDRSKEHKRLVNHTYEESVYKLGKHRSNAHELVHNVPVVEVDGDMAICDGGGGALGHPLEYIALHRPNAVEYCKYCSLRFTKKK